MNNNNNKTDVFKQSAVLAIWQEQNTLLVVKFKNTPAGFEIAETKSCKLDGKTDKHDFFTELGLYNNPQDQANSNDEKNIVAGFNSANLIFRRLSVPTVSDEELAPMIRLQAETLLPLPPEQMELTWRKDKFNHAHIEVLVAAGRKNNLEQFVKNVRQFEPSKIFMDCEAIVKTWKVCFADVRKLSQKTIIKNAREHDMQVCLAEDGILTNATGIDLGNVDFANQNSSADETVAQRLVHDLRNITNLFGFTEPTQTPIYVLSDGNNITKKIVSSLKAGSLKVQTVAPKPEKIKSKTTLTAAQLYEYRVPIGLGLLALDNQYKPLNIFEHLYKPKAANKKVNWRNSPKITAALAVLMLVLTVFTFYLSDVAKLGTIEKKFHNPAKKINCTELIERQRLIKTIASKRPDMLDLINKLNTDSTDGIELDRLDFKKGRPVTIAGHAKKSEQLYKYEKSLMDVKGIKKVKIQNTSKDTKTKKLSFTIIFDYKTFSRK